mmetsp:Transcript_19742/g.39725  ORF Transcript_19742/g.39725 Transcript_19742/m.39725 type:complete len:149 (+) Transcript_19742:2398-2844(+)
MCRTTCVRERGATERQTGLGSLSPPHTPTATHRQHPTAPGNGQKRRGRENPVFHDTNRQLLTDIFIPRTQTEGKRKRRNKNRTPILILRERQKMKATPYDEFRWPQSIGREKDSHVTDRLFSLKSEEENFLVNQASHQSPRAEGKRVG